MIISINREDKPALILNFTPREIDIISCLLTGKSSKVMGELLSISTKTVEVHVQNIMGKMECNSRQHIIQVIEHSDYMLFFSHHYHILMMNYEWNQKLIELGHRIIQFSRKPILLLIDGRNFEKEIIISKFQETAKLANIELDTESNVAKLNTGNYPKEMEAINIVCITCSKSQDAPEVKESLKHPNTIFVVQDNVDTLFDNKFPLIGWQNNYQLLVFMLIKAAFPQFISSLSLDSQIKLLEQQWERIRNIDKESIPVFPKLDKLNSIKIQYKYSPFSITSIVLIILIGVVILPTYFIYRPTSTRTIVKGSVTSELSVPNKSQLLDRLPIIEKIKERFAIGQIQDSNNIQTVVLSGLAGAGKTTVARLYAKEDNSEVIWEINAQDTDAILQSLSRLGYALASSNEEKEELNRIKKSDNSSEYAEKLIQFIQNKLSTCTSWLLVFDNVDKISDIEKFLPRNLSTWGKGRLLITTRNANIKNNNHIDPDDIIMMEDLSADEQYTLFTKILYGANLLGLQNSETIREIKEFLKKIPRYPLDISTAAYFIKTTNISFTEYIENMNSDDKGFYEVQTLMLKEMLHYAKGRYEVITLSLKKLIEDYPICEGLLYFISILDSQDIPKTLLAFYRDKISTEKFINDMQQYSLLTSRKQDIQGAETFDTGGHINLYIHRSVHKITGLYLKNSIPSEKQKEYLDKAIDSLESYCEPYFESSNIDQLRNIAIHLNAMLANGQIKDVYHMGSIKTLLGRIFYTLWDFVRAKEYFQEGVSMLEEHYKGQISKKLVQARTYLGSSMEWVGGYDAGIKLLEQQISLYKTYFPQNELDLAFALKCLATSSRRKGKVTTGLACIQEAYNIYSKFYVPHHIINIKNALELGLAYTFTGEYKKSEETFEHALLMSSKNNDIDKNDMMVLNTKVALSVVYIYTARYQEAIKLLEENLTLLKKYYPENRAVVVFGLKLLFETYLHLGLNEIAVKLVNEYVEFTAATFGKDHYYTICSRSNLGIIHLLRHDYKGAEPYLEEGYKSRAKLQLDTEIDLGKFSRLLGELYICTGRITEAEAVLNRHATAYAKHYGENHIEYGRFLLCLGELEKSKKNYDKAKMYFEKARKIYKDNNHVDIYKALEGLGDLYVAKGYKAEAERYYQDALAIVQTSFPAESAHIDRLQKKASLSLIKGG